MNARQRMPEQAPNGQPTNRIGQSACRIWRFSRFKMSSIKRGETIGWEVIGSLERMCLQLRKEHAASEFTVDVGVPYLQIPEIAKKLRADLMVIAKHNYSWLERFIFGGDAERILRRTPCPVLVVDENDGNTA